MNEKIKDLAEQADFFYNPANQGTAEQLENFANLIILECIKAVDDIDPDSGVGDSIIEHFGLR